MGIVKPSDYSPSTAIIATLKAFIMTEQHLPKTGNKAQLIERVANSSST